jgi:ribosomal-protein-alanine N-acetyltransferase
MGPPHARPRPLGSTRARSRALRKPTGNHPGYFLRTTRLGFRDWTESDEALATELWGNAAVTRLIGGPFTRAEIERRLTEELQNRRVFGVSYWPIFLLDTDLFVGCCGLRPHESRASDLEMGCHLLPQFWGAGLAEEACRGVIQFAGAHLGVRSLFAGHHPENAASRRLLLRLGFRFVRNELYPPTARLHPSYRLNLTPSP